MMLHALEDRLLASIIDASNPALLPANPQMIAPEIETMAEELGDSVILSKMDCTSDNDNKKWAMGESAVCFACLWGGWA